jgi:hypothetical protein
MTEPWMTDELVEKTRKFLGNNPEGDKRAKLARLLNVTEFKARLSGHGDGYAQVARV